jgi:hypothetical protein
MKRFRGFKQKAATRAAAANSHFVRTADFHAGCSECRQTTQDDVRCGSKIQTFAFAATGKKVRSTDFVAPRVEDQLSSAITSAYSGVIRPLIPKVSGHPFRFYPTTDSGASGHPVM